MDRERPPSGLADPVTFGPSCRRSSHSATFPPPTPASEIPCQAPVTSTVTSVRSIQSGFAQPPRSASARATTSKLQPFPHFWLMAGSAPPTAAISHSLLHWSVATSRPLPDISERAYLRFLNEALSGTVPGSRL